MESLLLSRDAEVVRVLRPTLEKLSIEVEICQEAKKASEILISEKFDAVIVDCDDLQRWDWRCCSASGPLRATRIP